MRKWNCLLVNLVNCNICLIILMMVGLIMKV